MKKSLFILTLFACITLSCSNDDDNPESPETIELSGTHWVKTTDNSRHFTFTSSSEYVYEEDGNNYPGTYVFNGEEGVMTETSSSFELEFRVNGNILSANQNTNDPDFEALYEKQ
ncbi:MAG: hypothetical protein ACK5M1_15175 [Xanthomarina gelatinilytica]|uniref:hypothetical protein n=1 Tax=Xanthomarina gelatinilytica TaxID=1137281 RepID=UPI003A8861FD